MQLIFLNITLHLETKLRLKKLFLGVCVPNLHQNMLILSYLYDFPGFTRRWLMSAGRISFVEEGGGLNKKKHEGYLLKFLNPSFFYCLIQINFGSHIYYAHEPLFVTNTWPCIFLSKWLRKSTVEKYLSI